MCEHVSVEGYWRKACGRVVEVGVVVLLKRNVGMFAKGQLSAV